ncbi:MAG: IS1595 family transposase [Hyphomonadaceae bacterium]|nr:IS1595 family transposase [Hyphomonadaceae bacterium]
MTKPTTVREFFKLYPDDESCLAHLFDVRFGQGHVCPKCSRSARWYPIKADAAFSCQWCGHHIHPKAGTLFEKSRTPLQLWFYAVFLFTKTRHGVSAKELERQLGVTYKCAFRMARKIRKHMAAVEGDEPVGGPGEIVEIDEAYVGGVVEMQHRNSAKAIVIGMVERGEGGRVSAEVIPDVLRATMHEAVEDNVEKGTEIHADMHRGYDHLDKKGYTLRRINKERLGRYVTDSGVTVNAVENFWRHLKCSIQGTHVSVSPEYLETYVKEFQFRFNRRMTPNQMLSELLTRFPELDA